MKKPWPVCESHLYQSWVAQSCPSPKGPPRVRVLHSLSKKSSEEAPMQTGVRKRMVSRLRMCPQAGRRVRWGPVLLPAFLAGEDI